MEKFVTSIPGSLSLFGFESFFPRTVVQPQATNRTAKKCLLFLTLFLVGASMASAQDSAPPPPTQSQEPPEQSALPTPPPLVVAPSNVPAEPVFPVPKPSAPFSAQAPLPAAFAPAIEAQVGFSTLSRDSSNTKILFKGINASITGQSSDRFGATFETSYLRASNVFGTGHSNSVLTFLAGPVWYPHRLGGFVTSVHVLGGPARVSGVVVLMPSTGGLIKGTVDDFAWVFGTSLEKWFTDSLAARVDIDALHTSFYNSSVKIQGEYDLRATWGLIYYFGGRKRGAKIRSFAGKQIE